MRTQPGISTWFQPQEPSNPAATRPEAEGAPIARENDLQKKKGGIDPADLAPLRDALPGWAVFPVETPG